jgi:cytochrome c-type biogenesis protein CcmF
MIGSILLTAAFLAALASTVLYIFNYRGVSGTLNPARISYHVSTILVIVASALLMQAILTHQYQYAYVYSYSGSGLPFGLLMSTFYAGQEGSFMMWTLFTAIVGLFLLSYSSKRGDLEPRVMAVFGLSQVFLLAMVSPLLKNPFAYIYAQDQMLAIEHINPIYYGKEFLLPFLRERVDNGAQILIMGPGLFSALQKAGISVNDFIIQGKGLNPLLQNFWMQIHPPFLFVGFALSTVPFAFAVSALIKNEYKEWIKQALPWTLAGAMVLGFAIMLGGYWAYSILGWGGYWGWDPVENSSLVPWLIGAAALHTMLVQKKTQANGPAKLIKTNLLLNMFVYLFVIYSTFLTRSGILGDASVHSFTDPGKAVYMFLVIYMITFLAIGIGFVAYRWKSLEVESSLSENPLNRELALFTGAVALIAAAIIIIAGTSAPIFGSAVEISFYGELTMPIAIIIGLLNGGSLLLKWKQTDGKDLLKKSLYSAGAALAFTVLMSFVLDLTFMYMLLTYSAAFALFVNVEIGYKIIKGKKLMLGAYVAHTGIALFLLGVVATSNFTEDKTVDLEKGKPTQAFGYTLTFTGIEPFADNSRYRFHVQVKDGDNVSTVSPVMFENKDNNSLMREPDIFSQLTRDFYIAPVGYDDPSAAAEATIQKGQSIEYQGAKIAFENFEFDQAALKSMQSGTGGEMKIGAKLHVDYNGKHYDATPVMQVVNGERTYTKADVPDANLSIELTGLDASGVVTLAFAKMDGQPVMPPKETLSIHASVKPFVNLVWAGVIFTAVGFLITVVRRTKESRA